MSLEKFANARQAAQRGDRVLARKLLSQVLLADRNNEQAWLLMARLADTEQQVIECLEWAQRINPSNASTRNALRILKRQHASPLVTAPAMGTSTDIQSVQAVVPPSLKSEKLTPLTRADSKVIPSPHRKTNWALLVGTAIVLLVVLIAAVGPQIAPQDPMEEHPILQVGDEWFIPPFDAFQVPGYILGSDEFGRDLFSRILYAIRPTLVMVAIVAMVRLFIGTLIGLGAGWSNGRVGRFLDMLISAALSVPILMVALGAIAMLGAELGLTAFIVGLSINGWGETARFVREQTRLIKGQLYIESAHALGASTVRILVQHILRQIMPMVWMLFAFEISGTLMVTAGLGFLGYFIGGDVWVEVWDFVSRRISGAPELGQMLATSWVNLLRPWPLVLTGSVIFFTILGFNLLGDGLRFRLNPEYINRNSLLARLSNRFSFWFEQSMSYPASAWLRANRLRPMLVTVAVLLLAGSIYLYQTLLAGEGTQALLAVPGGHVWASESIDPYGTSVLNSPGPVAPQELWVVNYPAGISGSPVVSADGTIYVAGLDAYLLALKPDGSTLWEESIPEIPIGSPAIDPGGTIYIADSMGGLSAVSSEGNLLWTHTDEAFGKSIHGPIVAPDGVIYYLLEDARGDSLIALLPDGQVKWSVATGTKRADVPLRLSPDTKQIFVKNVAFHVEDGSLVDITLPTQGSAGWSGHEQFFVGADGKTYLLAGHTVLQWELTAQGFSIVQSADWNYRGIGFFQTSQFPREAVVTPDGIIRLIYSGRYGATQVVWLGETGKYLGTIHSPMYQGTQLIAVDSTDAVIICGVGPTDQGSNTAMCEAFHNEPGDGETLYEYTLPLWQYYLGADIEGVVGAAMAPGRLYVVTGDGNLTALGETDHPPAAP